MITILHWHVKFLIGLRVANPLMRRLNGRRPYVPLKRESRVWLRAHVMIQSVLSALVLCWVAPEGRVAEVDGSGELVRRRRCVARIVGVDVDLHREADREEALDVGKRGGDLAVAEPQAYGRAVKARIIGHEAVAGAERRW